MRLAPLAVLALLATAIAPNAFAAATLDTAATDALKAALADEHHAEAFYDAVLKKFGDVRPFSNIIGAERIHAQELGLVMATYGMSAEANTLLGSKEIADAVPDTIEEACEAACAHVVRVSTRPLPFGPSAFRRADDAVARGNRSM